MPAARAPQIRIFRTRDALRRWLEHNHAKVDELWIGFYRKESGKTSVTYSEALDEALCFGWIDGVRKKIDEITYANRFTPRRARSIWSAVNVKRVEALIAQHRMHASGLAAFNARTAARTGVYSFEQRTAQFTPAQTRVFKRSKPAWAHFQQEPPGYRRLWVTSAKKEETQLRRLEEAIRCAAAGRRINLLAPRRKDG